MLRGLAFIVKTMKNFKQGVQVISYVRKITLATMEGGVGGESEQDWRDTFRNQRRVEFGLN